MNCAWICETVYTAVYLWCCTMLYYFYCADIFFLHMLLLCCILWFTRRSYSKHSAFPRTLKGLGLTPGQCLLGTLSFAKDEQVRKAVSSHKFGPIRTMPVRAPADPPPSLLPSLLSLAPDAAAAATAVLLCLHPPSSLLLQSFILPIIILSCICVIIFTAATLLMPCCCCLLLSFAAVFSIFLAVSLNLSCLLLPHSLTASSPYLAL